MKKITQHFSLVLFSLTLIACQGLDLENDNNDSENDLIFNLAADLENKILFSDDLLKRDIQGGFVLRIDELGSKLKEIGFVRTAADEVLFGDYNWELIDDKLVVSYPRSITCTTTKIEDTNDAFDSKVSCSGGTPDNAEIKNELIKPLSLTTSNFSDKDITITLSDSTTEVLNFDTNSDASFTFTKESNPPRNGTYEISSYTNVVKVDHTYDATIVNEGDWKVEDDFTTEVEDQ